MAYSPKGLGERVSDGEMERRRKFCHSELLNED